MPSNDLAINVRQIAGYTPVGQAIATDTLLIQQGGLGGPYASIGAAALVATALSGFAGGMNIGGPLAATSFAGLSAQFSNATVNLFSAQRATITNLDATFGCVGGSPIATILDVAATVTSFNGRVGAVTLNFDDIRCAGGAPLWSPRFEGEPRAPSPSAWSNSSRIATTAFVQQVLVNYISQFLATQPLVFTFNGRTGDVTLQASDLEQFGAEFAPLASPAFTGVPTAPTALPTVNNTQLATTAFVYTAVAMNNATLGSTFAPLASPSFIGQATAPTAAPGTNTGQIATTAFVQAAISGATAGVASFNGRTGIVTLTNTDIGAAGGAPLNSPNFTGVPQAPTAAPATSSTQVANCAWVLEELAGATTGVLSFNGRGGAVTLISSDLTSAGGALSLSPVLTGTPTAPTAANGTNSAQLATCAFVQAALSSGGVTSFNGRNGAVTLGPNDISAAGGAALASPAFTGVPTAPTAAPGTNTGQLATTAFVINALPVGGIVSSFNTRTGSVTLTSADLTGAGGALLSSPIFTGVPAGPTAAPGTSTTQLSTTAFVTAAIGAAAYLPLAGGTLTGALTAPGITVAGANPLLGLSKTASGGVNALVGSTGGNSRWQVILGDAAAESGGNVGSDFYIYKCTDAGAQNGFAMAINRANGNVTLPGIVLMGNFASPLGVSVGAFNNVNSLNYSSATGLVSENTLNACFLANRIGGNGIVHNFLQGAVQCGSITVANANSTAFNTTSDGRLKEDRQAFDAGPILDALEVWDFRWKAVPGRSVVRGHGVIAQDAQAIFPAAIFHDEGQDTWGADYSKFVPLLLNEIKALRLRIAALEERA
jgi:hypothetical protein